MKIMNLGIAVTPKKEKVEEQGLIIMPDTVKITSTFKEGVVVGVGNGTEDRIMEVKVGDTIMFKKGIYPTSGDAEVISLDDVLYICERKCAGEGCDNTAMRETKFCMDCFKLIF